MELDGSYYLWLASLAQHVCEIHLCCCVAISELNKIFDKHSFRLHTSCDFIYLKIVL